MNAILWLEEIMVTDPLTIEASAPLVDAARRMRDGNVGMLPIVDSGRLCSVITDRDVVVRSVAVGADPTAVRVGDIATADVVSAHPGWSVEKAIRVMAANQVGRLPVVDDRQQLVGVVTLSSLVLRSGKAAHTMDAARRIAQRSAKERRDDPVARPAREVMGPGMERQKTNQATDGYVAAQRTGEARDD